MEKVTNETLRDIIDNQSMGILTESVQLFPVSDFLQNRSISQELYAAALTKINLTGNALDQLDALQATAVGATPELLARASLLRLFLERLMGNSSEDNNTRRRRKIVQDLYKSLPYHQGIPREARYEPRPGRVEITSPVRIDLGMGGLSDLAPWTNEQTGRAVSLCAIINGEPPIRCIAEVTTEPTLQLEMIGRASTVETVATWQELTDLSTTTAIARASLVHLFPLEERNKEFPDLIVSLLGGGLRLQIFSIAPKGLGSSSILASVILQALLRLLGCTVDWRDIVYRTVAIESLISSGGGWEDALPAFFGGVVLAESVPAQPPDIHAQRLATSPGLLTTLQERLVLFDTAQEGLTGEILAEGILHYLSGDPATLEVCNALLNTAEFVLKSIENEDVEELGALLGEQWRLWKIITRGKCTNDYLEGILKGAEPLIVGAKVNGAGMGGAMLFLVQDGMRDQLVAYLHNFEGTILHWQPDTSGYELREWYNPARFASFIKRSLPDLLRTRSSYDRHGAIVACEVQEFPHGNNNQALVGPLNPAIFDLIADLPLSIMGTAGALVTLVGTATKSNLRSIKKLIDATASAVFSDEMEHWLRKAPVGTSEGKDEYGEAQPAVQTLLPNLSRRMELSTAVDVVDGTTPSATGQAGAYSICAVGEGLRSFPDMQAYAILAPASTFSELDLVSLPEIALEHNLEVVARALGKRVNELVMVTHSMDTGIHHQTLIRKMKAQGVSVIVPDPVIVEPPYAAAACIGHSSGIDGMIGVFGLPEIAINTVLCGTLNRGKGFIFRLASNAPMQVRDQTTLDGIFDLTIEERREAASHGLSAEKLYTFDEITSGFGCMFASAAVTDDPLLGLRGVTKNRRDVAVEGWFVDPCGNMHKLLVRFERLNLIDYTVRYPLPLFDISLVVDLNSAKNGTPALQRIKELASHIHQSLSGVYVPPFDQTSESDSGLHITLYEFVVDYVSSVDMQTRNVMFEQAASFARSAAKELSGTHTITLGTAKRTPGGVIVSVDLDDRLKEVINGITEKIVDRSLFNHLFAPQRFHITLARFTEVQTHEALRTLDQLIHSFNEVSNERVEISRLLLQRAGSTPFRDIQEHISLVLEN